MKAKNLCGIILAGGQSKRMGNDKSLLRINGLSFIEILTRSLSEICDEIIISSNSNLHKNLGYKIIHDEINSYGPISGIYSCIKESACEYYLIVATDTPLLSIELLQYLKKNAVPGKISAIVQESGFVEPLCAIYPKSIGPALKKFILGGNYKLIDFLIINNFHPVKLSADLNFNNPSLFFNVNTSHDFKELLKLTALR